MSALRYSLDEALVSLRRGRRSAAVSVLTITMAFVTLGGFLLALTNLEAVAEQWADSAELSVYLRDEIDADLRLALERDLESDAAVAAVEFVSKEEALRRFRQEFPELADVTETISGNPFPASLEVRLRSDARSGRDARGLVEAFSTRDGVADVQFDQRWLTRVMAVVAGVRLVTLGVGIVLLLGAAFTVAAVVRLSLVARRGELEIMELVGAPFAFVRGPFITEGVLQGGLGAILALVILGVVYVFVKLNAGDDLAGLLGSGELRSFGIGTHVLVILTGLLVGGAAGALASRPSR